MTTLELLVLIGSVVVIAAVWLVPIGRSEAEDQSSKAGKPHDSDVPVVEPAPEVPSAGAVEVPVPVPVPLFAEAVTPAEVAPTPPVAAIPPVATMENEWVSFPREVPDQPSSVDESPSADLTPFADGVPAPITSAAVQPASIEIPVSLAAAPAGPVDSQPTTLVRGAMTSTASMAVSFTHPADTGSHPTVPARRPDPVIDSETPSTGGGAASQSAFPMSIPIPIAMAVAEPPEPEIADTVDPVADPVVVPVRRTTPFENVSASASSVSFSPHPVAEEPRRSEGQSWTGSQSVVARVSGIELRADDESAKRRLLMAAGAGLVVALAVATRR